MDLRAYSEILLNVTTSIGIVVGGWWAYRKWGFERRREILALDGSLTHEILSQDSSDTLVRLQAIWRNQGPDLIRLDPERTTLSVFDLGQRPSGWILPANNPEAILTRKPVKERGSVWFEPNTESQMIEHVVLPTGGAYLCRLTLFHKRTQLNWFRDVLIDARTVDQVSGDA